MPFHLRPHCQEIIVVTGSQSDQLRPLLGDVTERYHARWNKTEMRHSLYWGIQDLPSKSWVVITPVDVLPLSSPSLQTLVSRKRTTVMVHNKQRGHPIFASAGFLQNGLLEKPLCDLLRGADTLEGSKEVLYNFNRPETWEDCFSAPPRCWREEN